MSDKLEATHDYNIYEADPSIDEYLDHTLKVKTNLEEYKENPNSLATMLRNMGYHKDNLDDYIVRGPRPFLGLTNYNWPTALGIPNKYVLTQLQSGDEARDYPIMTNELNSAIVQHDFRLVEVITLKNGDEHRVPPLTQPSWLDAKGDGKWAHYSFTIPGDSNTAYCYNIISPPIFFKPHGANAATVYLKYAVVSQLNRGDPNYNTFECDYGLLFGAPTSTQDWRNLSRIDPPSVPLICQGGAVIRVDFATTLRGNGNQRPVMQDPPIPDASLMQFKISYYRLTG